MLYEDKAKGLVADFKPELAARLTDNGKRTFAIFLVLGCQWSAGDALAGNMLMGAPIKPFKDALSGLGCPTRDSLGGLDAWAVLNLDGIASFLLAPAAAERLISGAKMGTGC